MTLPPARHAPDPRLGFTLTELLIMLLISAIALAVGAVRFGGASLASSEAQRTARQLVADLRLAQSHAVTEARNHYLVFTDGGAKFTQYAIYGADPAGDVQIEPVRALPDSVALTGASTRVEFTPGGDAVAGCSYIVTSPGRAYTITVTLATGAVTFAEAAP